MAAFVAPTLPMPKVATGIPGGICTVLSSASKPCSGPPEAGTPSTGTSALAASTPARCAAMPAMPTITSMPRPFAVTAYSCARAGVRCAEMMRTS